MEEEKKYRYNDATERYIRMNSFYMAALVFLWLLLLIYLFMKTESKNIALPTAYGNIILIAAFAVSDFIMHFRNKSSKWLKTVVSIQFGIEFLLLGMQTDSEFIYFAMLGVLALQIPYYDYRLFKRIGAGYGVLLTVVLVIRAVKRLYTVDVDSICRVLCIYLLIFILVKVGSIAKTFSDHALGGVEAQRIKQKKYFRRNHGYFPNSHGRVGTKQ